MSMSEKGMNGEGHIPMVSTWFFFSCKDINALTEIRNAATNLNGVVFVGAARWKRTAALLGLRSRSFMTRSLEIKLTTNKAKKIFISFHSPFLQVWTKLPKVSLFSISGSAHCYSSSLIPLSLQWIAFSPLRSSSAAASSPGNWVFLSLFLIWCFQIT